MFAFDQTNFRDLIPFHRNLQKYTGIQPIEEATTRDVL